MPLVKIYLNKAAPAERASIIGDVVHEALQTVVGIPEDDRFQIITQQETGDIIYPENGYLGITYSPDFVIIQMTWSVGRTVEVKKQIYRTIAEGVARKAGISQQDVFINIVEVVKENWSFGNGEMQYATD